MIRIARLEDDVAIRAIYAPVVEATPISFEIDPPSPATIRQRIGDTLATHPWLVYEHQESVCGYAYASRHGDRAAYQWSADVSVYVHPRWRRYGVGRTLYSSLLAVLRLQGFFNAYAGITLPNPASVGLHEALGFQLLGVYREVGFKLGAWHDVGWWHLGLRPKEPEPALPVPFSHILDLDELPAALEVGRKHEARASQQADAGGTDAS